MCRSDRAVWIQATGWQLSQISWKDSTGDRGRTCRHGDGTLSRKRRILRQGHTSVSGLSACRRGTALSRCSRNETIRERIPIPALVRTSLACSRTPWMPCEMSVSSFPKKVSNPAFTRSVVQLLLMARETVLSVLMKCRLCCTWIGKCEDRAAR